MKRIGSMLLALAALSLMLLACRQVLEKVPAEDWDPMPIITPVDSVRPRTEEPEEREPDSVPTPSPEAELEAEGTGVPTEEPVPTEIPESDPVIILTGGNSIFVDADFVFSDPGYQARDYLGNDLTSRVVTEGEIIPYLTGTYEKTYSVMDDYGNSCTLVRSVTVQKVSMPEVVMPPEKTVYLTFDDGPCSSTEFILDVLKEYDAQATFFVVGNRVGDGAILRRMQQEGHSIGVHSYTHVYKEIYKSEEAFFEDFRKTEEAIFEATGIHTRIFRFPGGSANTASFFNRGIMTRLTKIMEDMGYRYFDWNHSAGDADGQTDKTAIDYYLRVLTGIRSHPDYAIILQHDINAKSARAVKEVLKWGTENGYTFRALDLTSPVMHSNVNN